MNDLHEFLTPINLSYLNDDAEYNDGHFGSYIKVYDNELPDVSQADIVLVGVNEQRGAGMKEQSDAANVIRKQLYRLNYWHTDISIADIGNIKPGFTLQDTYAALRTVLTELIKLERTVIIIGGSHDITLPQYQAYGHIKRIIEATVVDSAIDLKSESMLKSQSFLMEMLTGEPNFIKHYNHIGFQSYFVHPRMLETLDKLRFDCFRVGVVKESIEEMEPVLRNTDLMSFDISAIRYSDAPSTEYSPNGFTGEEACTLMRFAGMSAKLSTAGIYGYQPEMDYRFNTAKQIAQMIWYFIDGKSRSNHEAQFDEKQNFNEYHTVFTDSDTMFLQSKRTNRWWMQLPGNEMIACSYNDYVNASRNVIPERWLRAQERL
jgi:arginase family enzyme